MDIILTQLEISRAYEEVDNGGRRRSRDTYWITTSTNYEKGKMISYWIQATTKKSTREQPPKTHLQRPKPSLKRLKEFRPDLHEFKKQHCIHRFL
ncbi:unnamed protein product [Lactuca virosa]|uniref:Uncharacterized protein n=1 Tax=Lactuca virosa TaxID=75947 RepID=A0AAU9LV10_9ASTR|nr:unnamed protein product [Lactuca virosa]